MKKNVGIADLIVRVVLALGLFYIGFMDNPIMEDGMPKTIVGIIGFVPLLTGLLRFCPLYAMIGVSTCPSCDDGTKEEACSARRPPALWWGRRSPPQPPRSVTKSGPCSTGGTSTARAGLAGSATWTNPPLVR